jgi:hypothetical protein
MLLPPPAAAAAAAAFHLPLQELAYMPNPRLLLLLKC